MPLDLQIAPARFDQWGGGVYGSVDLGGVGPRQITSPFGPRPITQQYVDFGLATQEMFDRGETVLHEGIDVDWAMQTAVRALSGGVVVENPGDDWRRGYRLEVQFGDWHWTVRHLNEQARDYAGDGHILQPGESVSRLQDVMRSGNSGRSTGPHGHIDVSWKRLEFRDPTQFFRAYAIAEALAWPPLDADGVGDALLTLPSVIMLREASDMIQGGETYRVVLQRREDNGEVV